MPSLAYRVKNSLAPATGILHIFLFLEYVPVAGQDSSNWPFLLDVLGGVRETFYAMVSRGSEKIKTAIHVALNKFLFNFSSNAEVCVLACTVTQLIAPLIFFTEVLAYQACIEHSVKHAVTKEINENVLCKNTTSVITHFPHSLYNVGFFFTSMLYFHTPSPQEKYSILTRAISIIDWCGGG